MTCTALAQRSIPATFAGSQLASHAVAASVRHAAAIPFDAMRVIHAGWVQAGWVESSIIGSGRFERMLDTLEKVALGPLARRV